MFHHHASRTFMLRPVPPFRLDLTVWALRRRRRNLIDRWDGTQYRRVVVVGGRPTELAVRQAGSFATPRLSVTATPPPRTVLDRRHVRVTLERLLGLRIDLTGKVPGDWVQPSKGPCTSRPRPRDHPRRSGSRSPRAGTRCRGAAGPARVTWRRPLDSRIRAAQRFGPPPRDPW